MIDDWHDEPPSRGLAHYSRVTSFGKVYFTCRLEYGRLHDTETTRIAFMGTPQYAIPVLSALVGTHDVVGVYTRPDKPDGRGKHTVPPPVKRFALGRDLPVRQPHSLKPAHVGEELAALAPDVIVVAAYGRFIPAGILGLPPYGFLNVHPSLLPKYRGPSPVASAILNGDAATGVTIIRLDEGMDSGPILAARETEIGPCEAADALTARLFEIGASLMDQTLPRWTRGEIEAQPQDDSQATITKLLTKEDGAIDWSQGVDRISRQVRAYHPWPGSFTRWRGRLLKVLEADTVESARNTPPQGQVVSLPDGDIGVGTGHGVLALSRVQLEGRRAVTARELIQGHPDVVGSTLGS